MRQITISLGVASLSEYTTTTFDQLVRAADAAMYYAKRTGKNRVAVAEDVQAS